MKTIPLTKGYIAVVDDEDHVKLVRHKWHAYILRDPENGLGIVYGRRCFLENGRRKSIFMHQAILGFSGVDHQDNDGLNNRRENLRKANQSQNSANRRKATGKSSRYKGVSRQHQRDMWRAAVTIHGRRIQLGTFREEFNAATAYNLKAYEVHGDFARLNQP